MKILVTGANGFVGKNLIAELENYNEHEIYSYDIDSSEEDLNRFTRECEFVYHLAGVNRPENKEDFMKGNFGFTSVLLSKLKENDNKCPILITSSIQAALDNPYGKSKKAGEELIEKYGKDNEVTTYVYRLPNLFGKWSRPNYNTVVATFCHNIANDIEIQMNNPDYVITLAYIDDVISEFTRALMNKPTREDGFCFIPVTHKITLGALAETIYEFKNSRNTRYLPNMGDDITKKLYSTYLSFLPKDKFAYDLEMHKDHRGSFTEFIRTKERGQVSVNISKPGITKGNHWHHSKNEKFLVVSGKGIIQFRKVASEEIIEYRVSGEKLQVVDIPTGYTHNIINTGDDDMVTIMWANECFDPDNPDTFCLEV